MLQNRLHTKLVQPQRCELHLGWRGRCCRWSARRGRRRRWCWPPSRWPRWGRAVSPAGGWAGSHQSACRPQSDVRFNNQDQLPRLHLCPRANPCCRSANTCSCQAPSCWPGGKRRFWRTTKCCAGRYTVGVEVAIIVRADSQDGTPVALHAVHGAGEGHAGRLLPLLHDPPRSRHRCAVHRCIVGPRPLQGEEGPNMHQPCNSGSKGV